VSPDLNPYAPPGTDEGHLGALAAAGGSYTLSGTTLVAAKGTALPSLCVWSGEPPEGPRIQARLYWAPLWTVIFVFSPLLYLIVYFLARKKGDLSYCLGATARRRRKQALLLGGGGMVASLVLMVVGGSMNEPLLLLGAVVTFLFWMFFAILRGRVVHVTRIDADSIHLKLTPSATEAFARLRP